jgi:hypothetical protein
MVVTGIPLPESKELAKFHKLSNNSLYILAHSTSLHIRILESLGYLTQHPCLKALLLEHRYAAFVA